MRRALSETTYGASGSDGRSKNVWHILGHSMLVVAVLGMLLSGCRAYYNTVEPWERPTPSYQDHDQYKYYRDQDGKWRYYRYQVRDFSG